MPASPKFVCPIRIHLKDGGGRRIRTFEGWANRFTVCPLWPLGNPSTLNEYLFTKGWCRLPESNWWPTDYKSVALPTELSRRVVSKWGVLYGKNFSWQVFFLKNLFFLSIRLNHNQKCDFLIRNHEVCWKINAKFHLIEYIFSHLFHDKISTSWNFQIN